MKKITFLFFIFSLTTSLGQGLSYSATASYNYVTCTGSGLNCSNSSINYSFSGATGQDQILNSSNPTITKVFNNIPLSSTYTFSSSGGYCIYNNSTIQVFQSPSSNTHSIGDLIKNSNANLLISGCFGSAFFSNFKPNNMIIQNLSANNDVCAGEKLNLAALPAGYPPEAYNWQYSLDNQLTWITVPQKLINGISTNRSPNSNFSIYDILGADHINYFRVIYFRIGYPGRPFSANTIKINYIPCAPLVTDVDFKGPDCYGDIVKSLSVTFNDKLDSAIGEQLASISVVDITNESKIFIQVTGSISYPEGTKKYTFPSSSFQQLETGHTYKIKYQAQIPNPANPSNPIMKGFLYSPVAFNFEYKEPKPLTFKIKSDNPACHDGKVDIIIEADGGTPPYYYDNLSGETEIINDKTEIKRIQFEPSDNNKKTVTIQQTELKQYNIKVTDANKCIER